MSQKSLPEDISARLLLKHRLTAAKVRSAVFEASLPTPEKKLEKEFIRSSMEDAKYIGFYHEQPY